MKLGLGSSKYKYAVIILIILHASITFGHFFLRKYNIHGTSLLDLGVFNQVLWNITNGNGPHQTILKFSDNWFGIHFSPILYSITPFYYIFPSPLTLHAVQSALLALAAWPIFKTTFLLTKNHNTALIWSLIYLINPYLHNAGYWDFHENAFAVLFISYALLFLIEKRFLALFVTLFLLILTKEHYGITCIGFGVIWWWKYRERKQSLILMVFGLVCTIVILKIIMPSLSLAHNHVMLESFSRYAWLKLPINEIINVLFNTIIPDGLRYLLLLLAGFFIFPLGGFIFLFAGLADFIANIASEDGMMKSIMSYHSAPLIPVMIISACVGCIKCKKWVKNSHIACLIFSTLLFLMFSPYALEDNCIGASCFYKEKRYISSADPHIMEIKDYYLKDNDIVFAQNNIGTYFSGRKTIISFPGQYSKSYKDFSTDKNVVVILYLDYPYESFKTIWFGCPYKPWLYIDQTRELLNSNSFGIISYDKKWLVMRKGVSDIIDRDIIKQDFEKMVKQYLPENYSSQTPATVMPSMRKVGQFVP